MFIYCKKNPLASKTAGISANTYVHNRDYDRFSIFIAVTYDTGIEGNAARMARKITKSVSEYLIVGGALYLEDIFSCYDEIELSHYRIAMYNGILKAASQGDAYADLSRMNIAVAVVDKETEKVYCFSYNDAGINIRTAGETILFAESADGVANIHTGSRIMLNCDGYNDSSAIEIRIFNSPPDEKEKLMLYTANSYLNSFNLRQKEERAVSSAIMSIAMDRTRQKYGSRVFVCGTYTSSVRDRITATVDGLYPDEHIRQFVEFSTAFAETGEYPQDSDFVKMAENLLKYVPVIGVKRNTMFDFLDD